VTVTSEFKNENNRIRWAMESHQQSDENIRKGCEKMWHKEK